MASDKVPLPSVIHVWIKHRKPRGKLKIAPSTEAGKVINFCSPRLHGLGLAGENIQENIRESSPEGTAIPLTYFYCFQVDGRAQFCSF